MRTSFLALMVVALAASTMTAASAFSYAQTGGRTITAALVDDTTGYLAIEEVDYGCYTDIASNGTIDLDFDAGTSCGGTGQGVNAGSIYYFHDVLKVTNKATATLNNVWINMTGSDIVFTTASALGTMTTGSTYGSAATTTNLAVGSSIWIGFKIVSTTKSASDADLTGSLAVEARTST